MRPAVLASAVSDKERRGIKYEGWREERCEYPDDSLPLLTV